MPGAPQECLCGLVQVGAKRATKPPPFSIVLSAISGPAEGVEGVGWVWVEAIMS